MKFKSKTVVNAVIGMLDVDLRSLIAQQEDLTIKVDQVKKGKHKIFSLKNSVFVSNNKWRPGEYDTRIYLTEIYFNVSHENPEKLEDLANDFCDCIVECFDDNPTLNSEVMDSNCIDGYFFVSEQNIHTALGKISMEITI